MRTEIYRTGKPVEVIDDGLPDVEPEVAKTDAELVFEHLAKIGVIDAAQAETAKAEVAAARESKAEDGAKARA